MKQTYKISPRWIFCTLCFLIHFRPASYVIGFTLNRLMNLAVILLSVLLAALAIQKREQGYRMKQPTFLALLVYFWMLIGSTVINRLLGNSVDFSDAVISFSNAFSFIMLCDLGMWESERKLMKSFLYASVPMTLLSALTFFAFYKSGGMNHNISEIIDGRRIELTYFLLARDNATYFWVWPVTVMLWLYYYRYCQKKSFLMITAGYTLIQSAAFLYVQSGLASAACLLVPAVMFYMRRRIGNFYQKPMKPQHRSPLVNNLWIGAVVFDVWLTVFTQLSWVQHIVQDVFHKNATLSGRTTIWARAFRCIIQSPIWGYGCETAAVTETKLGINHAHNIFLECLYRGGVIGLLLFAVMLIVLRKTAGPYLSNPLCKFLFVFLALFWFFSSVEFAFYRYHYLILLVAVTNQSLLNERPEEQISRVLRLNIDRST